MEFSTYEYPPEYLHLMEEHLSETLTLRYWPNPVLSEVAEALSEDEFGADLEAVGQQMIALMDKLGGLGLAAPQVGLLKRLFVLRFPLTSATDPLPPMILCNPVVLEQSTEGSFALEGCLSLPGIYQYVWRPTEVFLGYQTPSGEHGQMVVLGQEARVVCHEVDHLDGIVFFHPSRMGRAYRNAVAREWRKNGSLYVDHFMSKLA